MASLLAWCLLAQPPRTRPSTCVRLGSFSQQANTARACNRERTLMCVFCMLFVCSGVSALVTSASRTLKHLSRRRAAWRCEHPSNSDISTACLISSNIIDTATCISVHLNSSTLRLKHFRTKIGRCMRWWDHSKRYACVDILSCCSAADGSGEASLASSANGCADSTALTHARVDIGGAGAGVGTLGDSG